MASVPEFFGEEVVVRANPLADGVAAGAFPAPTGGSGPGGDGINRVIRENSAAAQTSISADSDVIGEEVVVQAMAGFKRVMLDMMMRATAAPSVTLPCIGTKSFPGTIRNMLANLKFQVVSRDFGPGRAGENLVNGSSLGIPVQITAGYFVDYMKLAGGPLYLIFHEIAHSFPEMRAFNKSQFEAFIRRDIVKDLSYEQQKRDFPFSVEFAENEARANSIARAMAQALNNQNAQNWFLANPNHGFTSQC